MQRLSLSYHKAQIVIPFFSKYIYKRSNSEWGNQKHRRTLGGIEGQNVDTDSWCIVCERFPSADVARLRRDKIGVLWSVATGGISSKNLCSSTCCYIIERQIKSEASCAAARVGNLPNTIVSEHEKVFWENDDLDDELASRCLANNTPKDSSSTRRQSAWDILVTTVLTEELLHVETGRPVDASGTDRGHINRNAEREIQRSLESKKIGGLVKSIGCFSIRVRTLPIGY